MAIDSPRQGEPTKTGKKILVIEDDEPLVEVLSYNLRQAGYDVLTTPSGEEGLALVQKSSPNLVVLDWMLPGMDGLEVCRRIRADITARNTKIIMLTAKGEETDQLIGFNMGADDYVTKPFSVKVLLERIRTCLRTKGNVDSEHVKSLNGVTVDQQKRLVFADNRVMHLTASEFEILNALIRQPDRIFDRAELISVLKGEDSLITERNVDTHIRCIRRKLGNHAKFIKAVREAGYKFVRTLESLSDDPE